MDILLCFLQWSLIINVLIFLLWVLMFVLKHDWIYLLHYRWFRIQEDTFDAIHYTLMGFYKMYILCFNLIPYIILLIISK